MQDIQKLIAIKSKKGQRAIQLVDQNFRNNEVSRDNQLYHEIIEGKVEDDLDGAYVLLNTDPSNRNYRNIKNKLREKLLNHLFFLDYSKPSETLYKQIFYECTREAFQINVLMLEEEYELAYKKAQDTLSKAEEYELWNIAINCLAVIRQSYSESGNIKGVKETNHKIGLAREKANIIDQAKSKYYSIITELNRSLTAQKKELENLPSEIKYFEELLEKNHLIQIELLYYNLKLLNNQFHKDFMANILLTDQIEKKYLNRPVDLIKVYLDPQRISFIKMYAYLIKRDFGEGFPYSQKGSKYFSKGSKEWVAFLEYAFLLSFKTKHYDEASEIWLQVRDSGAFKLIPKLDLERWELYRTYLAYFVDHKSIHWGFKVEEFLSLQAFYPKEKEGYNTAFLMIQLLFLFREEEIEAIEQKVEELEEYSSEALSKKVNYRNSVFIRMLRIMLDQEFSHYYTIEKAAFYREKLNDDAVEEDFYNYIEIIPYEDLWEIILNYLKEKKRFVHYRFYNT